MPMWIQMRQTCSLICLRTAADSKSFLIVLNFGENPHVLDLSRIAPKTTIAVATGLERTGIEELSNLELAANEGIVCILMKAPVRDTP